MENREKPTQQWNELEATKFLLWHDTIISVWNRMKTEFEI